MIKKIRILGIAPYKGLATLMKQCALQYHEIEFTAYAGSMEQGLALAKRYSEHYDVIIPRKHSQDDLPVCAYPGHRYWYWLL